MKTCPDHPDADVRIEWVIREQNSNQYWLIHSYAHDKMDLVFRCDECGRKLEEAKDG